MGVLAQRIKNSLPFTGAARRNDIMHGYVSILNQSNSPNSAKCPVICPMTNTCCNFNRQKTNGNGTSSSMSSAPDSPPPPSPPLPPPSLLHPLLSPRSKRSLSPRQILVKQKRSNCSSVGCQSKRPAQDCPNGACAPHCRALGGCHRHKVNGSTSKPFIRPPHAGSITTDHVAQSPPGRPPWPQPIADDLIDPVLLHNNPSPPPPTIARTSPLSNSLASTLPSATLPAPSQSSHPRFATASLGPQPSTKYKSQMANTFTEQSHQEQQHIEQRHIKDAERMQAERHIKDEVTFVVYRLVLVSFLCLPCVSKVSF